MVEDNKDNRHNRHTLTDIEKDNGSIYTEELDESGFLIKSVYKDLDGNGVISDDELVAETIERSDPFGRTVSKEEHRYSRKEDGSYMVHKQVYNNPNDILDEEVFLFYDKDGNLEATSQASPRMMEEFLVNFDEKYL